MGAAYSASEESGLSTEEQVYALMKDIDKMDNKLVKEWSENLLKSWKTMEGQCVAEYSGQLSDVQASVLRKYAALSGMDISSDKTKKGVCNTIMMYQFAKLALLFALEKLKEFFENTPQEERMKIYRKIGAIRRAIKRLVKKKASQEDVAKIKEKIKNILANDIQQFCSQDVKECEKIKKHIMKALKMWQTLS